MTGNSVNSEDISLVRRGYNALGSIIETIALVVWTIAFVGVGILAIFFGLDTVGIISVYQYPVPMIGFYFSMLWIAGAVAASSEDD